MSRVQFDGEEEFDNQKFGTNGGSAYGAIPRMSTETKLYLSLLAAIMIGATLFIWLRYIVSRPVSTNIPDMHSMQ